MDIYNVQEVIERLEQAHMPHAQALVIGDLFRQVQTLAVKGADSQAQAGTTEIKQQHSGTLPRIEQKMEAGFAAVQQRIDKLQADMDRRFELVSKEFELVRQDTDRRFETFQNDTNRRFELVLKEIELSRKDTLIKLGAMIMATAGVLFAALRYLPAG